MPRNPSPLPHSSQHAKPQTDAALPAPIRNRLAQSGHVSSPEVKQPQLARPSSR